MFDTRTHAILHICIHTILIERRPRAHTSTRAEHCLCDVGEQHSWIIRVPENLNAMLSLKLQYVDVEAVGCGLAGSPFVCLHTRTARVYTQTSSCHVLARKRLFVFCLRARTCSTLEVHNVQYARTHACTQSSCTYACMPCC